MTQTFTSTQNEIIRYVYDETSLSENLIIEDWIATDSDSLNFYMDCLELKAQMNKIILYPKEITLDRIFDYSKNFKPAV
jgi:hypothetical protein